MATIESARQSLMGLGVNPLVSMAPTLLDALNGDDHELQLSPPAHAALRVTALQELQDGDVSEVHGTEGPAAKEGQPMHNSTNIATIPTGATGPNNENVQEMASTSQVWTKHFVYEPERVLTALLGIDICAETSECPWQSTEIGTGRLCDAYLCRWKVLYTNQSTVTPFRR